MFKPIGQLRVSDAVVSQLKQSIVQGHFKTGSKLPTERELAQEFQVSRVVIHEALRKLENTGFVIIKQGATGGAFVTDLTFEYLSDAFLDLFWAGKISILELHNARLFIEPEIARLAALSITPENVEKLKAALKYENNHQTVSDNTDPRLFVDFVLAEICNNRILEATIKSLMRLTQQAVSIIRQDSTRRIHPKDSHNEIVAAVIDGDADAAEKAARKHSLKLGKIILDLEKEYREKKKTEPLR